MTKIPECLKPRTEEELKNYKRLTPEEIKKALYKERAERRKAMRAYKLFGRW